MNKYMIIVALIMSLIGSGWMVKNQNQTINRLEARIEEVESTRIVERGHFQRELERQIRLKQTEIYLKDLNDAAEKDTSDTGADYFSGSRLRRIDQIR